MSCLPGQTEDMQIYLISPWVYNPAFTIQHTILWVKGRSLTQHQNHPESFLKHRPRAPPRPTESEPQAVTTGLDFQSSWWCHHHSLKGRKDPSVATFLACPGIGWFWSPYSPGFHLPLSWGAQFSTVISTQPKGISACMSPALRTRSGTHDHPAPHTSGSWTRVNILRGHVLPTLPADSCHSSMKTHRSPGSQFSLSPTILGLLALHWMPTTLPCRKLPPFALWTVHTCALASLTTWQAHQPYYRSGGLAAGCLGWPPLHYL